MTETSYKVKGHNAKVKDEGQRLNVVDYSSTLR